MLYGYAYGAMQQASIEPQLSPFPHIQGVVIDHHVDFRGCLSGSPHSWQTLQAFPVFLCVVDGEL